MRVDTFMIDVQICCQFLLQYICTLRACVWLYRFIYFALPFLFALNPILLIKAGLRSNQHQSTREYTQTSLQNTKTYIYTHACIA